MKRYLDDLILKDLQQKMVIVTGPRQVGKTTLSKQLMPQFERAQYLNWDVAQDRRLFVDQAWRQDAGLLVLDEIHKMKLWKNWLKGVVDGRPPSQALLVTGSARMDTFRHAGESLAGRFYSYRLHPFSVKEWCSTMGVEPAVALSHLIERGGFPEPCMAESIEDANRWRAQYLTGLIRDDVLEFSRLREVGAMRLFVELLRDRVGSPLSLASIARDLAISPMTVATYLEILQALFIVFTIRPWHKNIARGLLKTPKVYFYDTGLVRGDGGVRLENSMATMLQKHVHFLQDRSGREIELHYVRTKDGAEVDFAISEDRVLTHLIECKATDDRVHPALARFSNEFPDATAVQLVGQLRQAQSRQGVLVTDAATWLAELSA
jgi:predicted AAA+ superfamily ATPase